VIGGIIWDLVEGIYNAIELRFQFLHLGPATKIEVAVEACNLVTLPMFTISIDFKFSFLNIKNEHTSR
jgi:hypothetical protein